MSTTIHTPTPVSTVQSQDQLGIPKIVFLHLFPGVISVAVFGLLSWFLTPLGITPMLAMMLAIPLAVIPLELGYLLYLGKKRNGSYSLQGIVLFREHLSTRQYLLTVPVVLVISLGLFLLLSPADLFVFNNLFAWWPAWLDLDPAHLDILAPFFWITIIIRFVMNGLLGPAVEELYFRGYLLPRMTRLGRWAAVVNSALFSLYHFWAPWGFFSRFLGTLPISVAAQRKRNVYIGVITHCVLNTIGMIVTLGALLAAG